MYELSAATKVDGAPCELQPLKVNPVFVGTLLRLITRLLVVPSAPHWLSTNTKVQSVSYKLSPSASVPPFNT